MANIILAYGPFSLFRNTAYERTSISYANGHWRCVTNSANAICVITHVVLKLASQFASLQPVNIYKILFPFFALYHTPYANVIKFKPPSA